MAPFACCSSFAAVALLALGYLPRHALAEAPAPAAPGRAAGSPYLVPLRRESVPIRRRGKVVSFKTSYSGNISVGRPAQEFRVVFDTGSGHLVLPAAECLSPSCLAHRRYNVSRSQTAVPINGDGSIVEPGALCDQVTIGFGTGEVTGEFVRERVCLGSEAWPDEAASINGLVSAPCVDMHVVTAVEMSTQPFRSFAFDGILGLALSGLALSERFSYLEVVASQQGGPLRDPRPAQFAAFLTEGDDGEASEIAFGGHNPTRALEPLSWAPVALPGLGYWQVQILSVRIGGVALDVCQDGSCRGVIDTGSSHLGVPATHEAQVAALLTRPAGSAGEDCRFASAPEVEIEIPGRNLTLGPENYMRRMPLEENVSVGVRGVSLNGSSPRRPRGGGGGALPRQGAEPRAGRRMAFKLREEPWRPKEEQPARPEVKRPAPGDADFPVDAETVRKNREGRVAYLEAREACQLEQKEINAVREQIGKEVRQACAPEIDEYVDCCVGRWFSLMACKPHALRMRRCMKKIETPEYVERRTAELMKERETAGESIVNNQGKGATRGRRAMYNRAILPEVDDPNEFLMRGKTGTRQ